MGTEWSIAASLAPGAIVRAVLVGSQAIRPRLQVVAVIEVVFLRRGRQDSDLMREVAAVLHGRGYDVPPGLFTEPGLLATKAIPTAKVEDERAFLESLILGTPRRRARSRSAPKTMWEFSKSFQAAASGAWLPYQSAWELQRSVLLAGTKANGGVMIHLAPRDQRGLRLGIQTSIKIWPIWPTWNGTGQLPKWLEGCRTMLSRQFRAVGHKATWHLNGRGRVIIASVVALRPQVRIGSIRRKLERAHLGEPDPE